MPRGAVRQTGRRNRFRRTLPAVRERAKRLLTIECSFVPNREFAQMAAEGMEPDGERSEPAEATSDPIAPASVGSIARLCEEPLLSAARTRQLFRRMNYCKYLANVARAALDPDQATAAEVEHIERCLTTARAARDEIIQSNVRLVVHIARDFASRRFSLDEAISDGITSLMTAVDKFDFDRGFQFTTYAYRIILRGIARRLDPSRQRSSHHAMLDDSLAGEIPDHRRRGLADEVAYDFAIAGIRQHLSKLDRRERFILRCRYALGRHRHSKSCQRLADILGISKERVRQLEMRAIEKLRRLVGSPNLTEA